MTETTELAAPPVAQAATPAEIVRVLSGMKLDAGALRQSHERYRRLPRLQTGMAAGWHNFDDIPTLVGLEGDFFWTEDWMRPARIALRFGEGREGIEGTYTIAQLADTVELGTFYCWPNNPAIGWAAVQLTPESGSPRAFTVAGMMTDSQWRISVLLLNKLGQSGPVNPPFSVLRML